MSDGKPSFTLNNLYFLILWRNSPTLAGRLIADVSRSLKDTPHAVGLLWTRDRPVAETSTWLHSQETHIHVPGGIRSRHPSKRTAADRAATCSATTPASLTKFVLTIPSTVYITLNQAVLYNLLTYSTTRCGSHLQALK
jgi:hypothetical protein